MTGRRSEYIPFKEGFTHVSTWGKPTNPALVMWHGLARTGRDFDAAAERLSKDYFVICPDTIGRGLSCWAKNPEAEYSLQNYAAQALSVLDHYKIDQTRWLGTSMGGLIGIYLAGGILDGRISHLVVNDIGPEVPSDALDRIIEYVGTPPSFASVPAFEQWLREVYTPFGQNTDTYWRIMTDTSARRLSDGSVTVHYDARIIAQFTHNAEELPLWNAYDRITAKTLLTRGVTSDVLPEYVAKEMRVRGPRPEYQTFENCGHAPTFTTPEAIEILEKFFA